MEQLTAFLILRDEERLLPRCLASLAGVVDAVVALDTGSRDRTPEILARVAADPTAIPLRWECRPFDDFGRARQAALDRVVTPWALWIDADEELSPVLRARLCELRRSGGLQQREAWEFRLENRVYGRVMRGRSLAGQYRVRLFRTDLGRITPTPVHEGLDLPSGTRIGRLEEPLRHDTLSSWRRYLHKVDRYTDLEAADGRRPRGLPLHILITLPATLWREYVGREGWRDGWPGLVWAATTAWSSLLRDWKLLRRSAGRP
jgi:glycosyltransferase involved in cell wall biosynthesis